jgi:hypothetical protein
MHRKTPRQDHEEALGASFWPTPVGEYSSARLGSVCRPGHVLWQVRADFQVSQMGHLKITQLFQFPCRTSAERTSLDNDRRGR